MKKFIPLAILSVLSIASSPVSAHIVSPVECMRFDHGMKQLCLAPIHQHNMEHQVTGSLNHQSGVQSATPTQVNPFAGLGAFSQMGQVLNGLY